MKFLPVLLVGLSPLFATALPAQEPQVNAETILRDLDRIEQQQKQLLTSSKTAAINRIRGATISGMAAASLYAEAYEAVELEGKPNHATLLSDWKAANDELLRSKEAQAILLLHLQYLALSLDRASSDKAEAFVAPSLKYVQDLIMTDSLFTEQSAKMDQVKADKNASVRDKQNQNNFQRADEFRKGLMQRSIADSIFSKWLRLGQWLPDKNIKWETSPGNLSGILEKNVRDSLREQKSPQLLSTWDLEMQYLADRATTGKLNYAAADFNTVVRPTMVFNRANDMVVIGQKNKAITDIYGLVKLYPQHPDFDKWVKRLRELLPSPAAPAAEAPAAPASAAPAATPPGTNP